MKRLHLVPEASEANGVFQVARMLAKRDGGESRDMDGVPFERHYFAKCDRVVVTGGWEEEWCRKWGLKGPFETVDLKVFFDLSRVEGVEGRRG